MSEEAKCRGCGRVLRGKAYHLGGPAHHPDKGGVVKACHYGGWVCSRSCDVRSCVELEGTMPGCGSIREYSQLSPYAKERIKNNWPE